MSYRSEARYNLRLELISTDTSVEWLTQITQLKGYHPDCNLLTHAYWRPTITPYIHKYLPVQHEVRKVTGGTTKRRSDGSSRAR
jgi:hypothetical protein